MYQKLVKYISFPLIARRDGLAGLVSHIKKLEQTQYWSSEQLREYQFIKIKQLFIHAYETTEFYKKRFDEAKLNPRQLKDFSEIEKLPLLTKEDIRVNLQDMISNNYHNSQLHSSETGGTTGVKMIFYRDNACLSPKEAALYRFEKWAGWDIGERMGLVWTAQQDYVGHWTLKSRIKNELFGRQVVFPAAIMDEELIVNYISLLQKRQPIIIRAFSSPIYEVAKFMLDRSISDIRLKGVITTGEPLYPHQRTAISSSFQCDVYDSYRCREVGPIAQECKYHQGMHINAESVYLEVVDEGGKPVAKEEKGDIVVTDLLNYGMPLIRYKMGDVGNLSDNICSCGRGLPFLKKIWGRTVDNLYTPEKKKITAGSLVLYLVDEAPGLIGQVQIIQDKLDHLIIRLTSNPPVTQEIIEYQKKTVKRLFGDKMRLSFEQVENIPREKSGKYRFTICNIPVTDL